MTLRLLGKPRHYMAGRLRSLMKRLCSYHHYLNSTLRQTLCIGPEQHLRDPMRRLDLLQQFGQPESSIGIELDGSPVRWRLLSNELPDSRQCRLRHSGYRKRALRSIAHPWFFQLLSERKVE